MKRKISFMICISLLSSPALALQWTDLWQTRDQQGMHLLKAGKPKEAAQAFKNKDWQAVSDYRAGDYAQAFKRFTSKNTSDAQYNAGNSAAFSGQYEEAIKAYDKAIALNPGNQDAITNRDIVKKLLEKKQQQNNSSSNQSENNKQDPAKQQKDQNQQNKQQNASNQQDQKNNAAQQNQSQQSAQNNQAKDEEKKQLMRRVDEDPGGLLRRKFLRDYTKRHDMANNPDQGDN